MKKKIALLGCGTIGGCLAKQLLSRFSDQMEIVKILVKDINKERPGIPSELLTGQANEILDDESIDLVVELLGNEEPALEYCLRSLTNKKHFVTANKELIAKHAFKIFDCARENAVEVALEASVAGGIPIIRPLLKDLQANQIQEVIGILNGTTNYILTRMERGDSFDEALAQAQEKGYAEPDSTNDLEGYDARYKIAILASLIFGCHIDPEQIECQGIQKITKEDFDFAKELGCSIKLLARAKKISSDLKTPSDLMRADVHPYLLPVDHALAKVDGVLNGIELKADLIPELLLVGPGAGPEPTVSALLADIFSICQGDRLAFTFDAQSAAASAKQLSEEETSYYLRLKVKDQIGVIRDVTAALAKHNISLQSIIQHEENQSNQPISLILLTHSTHPSKFRAFLSELTSLNCLEEICTTLQVLKG